MLFLQFALAMLPILWLIAALSGLKMAGHKACLIALLLTALLAAFHWELNAACTATAALEGILNALWPICLVIIAALFTYNLTLKTGAMELIKKMLAGVSRDRRVLALIIGWGFGNFMEGMAGFGTAVAIPASILVGIGLDPISTVIACLVVNSTPTARVFNTCKWNNMAETAELRLFLCQVYKNLMLYGVVFHVKQWYNGGYETLV